MSRGRCPKWGTNLPRVNADDAPAPPAPAGFRKVRIVQAHHTVGTKCLGCGREFASSSAARQHVQFGRCTEWGYALEPIGTSGDAHDAPPRDAAVHPGPIRIYGIALDFVKEFVYLGRTFTCDDDDDAAALARLKIAQGTFAGMRGRIFTTAMPPRTKIAIYTSVVAARLFHACETWILSAKMARKFDSFQQRCLRTCLGYRAILKDGHPYYPQSDSVLHRAGVQRLSDALRERQLQAGYALLNDCISPTVKSWSTAREPHACRNNLRLLADVLQQRMTLTRARQATFPRDKGSAEVKLTEHRHTAECPAAPTGLGGT